MYRTSTPQMKLQSQTEVSVTPVVSGDMIYTGDLPCADCEGIDVVLTLKTDGTFTQSNTYRGRDVQPYMESGKWQTIQGDAMNPQAKVFELTFDQEGSSTQFYLVSGNELQQLDENKALVEAPFNTSLTKKSN